MIGLMVLLAGSTAVDDCFVEKRSGGVTLMTYIGDRACIDFKPARLYHGVFVDNFEGQSYYDGAASLADIKGRHDKVWFSTDGRTRLSVSIPGPRYQGGIYRVTFLGREAKNMNREPLQGYGHFGMSAGVVLVDDLTEAVLLPAPRD
jgi:hypothetical protein